MSAPAATVPVTELRAMLTLSTPLVVGWLALMIMRVVNLAMVGRVSPEAMAVVAESQTFFFSVDILAQGTLMCLDPLISQAWGAGEPRRCGLWLLRGLVAAVILSVPVMALFWWGTVPLLTLLGQPPEVVPGCGAYLRIMVVAALPRLCFFAIRNYLNAQGRVTLPLLGVLLANVVNLPVAWVLVFGRLGFSPMGAEGVGWAIALSELTMGLFLAIATFAGPTWRHHQRPERLSDALDPHEIGRLFKMGLPLGIQHALEGWGFVFSTFMAGWLGAVSVAGHVVALNLASVAYMVPLGLSTAAAVRVGHGVGRGDRAAVVRSVGVAVGVAGVAVACMAALFATFPAALAGFYTQEAAVLALATSLIPIAAAFQAFDAGQAIGFGVLRGLGDLRFPALANLVAFWLLAIPTGWFLAFQMDLGTRGIWGGLALGLGAASTMVWLRIRWRLGRPLVRMEPG